MKKKTLSDLIRLAEKKKWHKFEFTAFLTPKEGKEMEKKLVEFLGVNPELLYFVTKKNEIQRKSNLGFHETTTDPKDSVT